MKLRTIVFLTVIAVLIAVAVLAAIAGSGIASAVFAIWAAGVVLGGLVRRHEERAQNTDRKSQQVQWARRPRRRPFIVWEGTHNGEARGRSYRHRWQAIVAAWWASLYSRHSEVWVEREMPQLMSIEIGPSGAKDATARSAQTDRTKGSVTMERWVRESQQVRAFYANDRTTRGEGRVIAYTDRPTLILEYSDGTRDSWLAELCEQTVGES